MHIARKSDSRSTSNRNGQAVRASAWFDEFQSGNSMILKYVSCLTISASSTHKNYPSVAGGRFYFI